MRKAKMQRSSSMQPQDEPHFGLRFSLPPN